MNTDMTPAIIREGEGPQRGTLAVSFYEKPVRKLVKGAVDKDGIQITPDTHEYWKSVMARIETPAMKNQIVDVEIELYDREGTLRRKKIWEWYEGQPIYYTDRFKAAYQAWRSNNGVAVGTMLETWAKVDSGMLAHFRAEGIRTLEQLAGVADAQLHVLGLNGRQWRDDARKRLEEMSRNEPIEEVRQENASLRAKMEEMQAQIAAMAAGQPERKKPGRPPKAAPEPTETAA